MIEYSHPQLRQPCAQYKPDAAYAATVVARAHRHKRDSNKLLSWRVAFSDILVTKTKTEAKSMDHRIAHEKDINDEERKRD